MRTQVELDADTSTRCGHTSGWMTVELDADTSTRSNDRVVAHKAFNRRKGFQPAVRVQTAVVAMLRVRGCDNARVPLGGLRCYVHRSTEPDSVPTTSVRRRGIA